MLVIDFLVHSKSTGSLGPFFIQSNNTGHSNLAIYLLVGRISVVLSSGKTHLESEQGEIRGLHHEKEQSTTCLLHSLIQQVGFNGFSYADIPLN